MAGGSSISNGKVKVRKVSLSVNSPARRKVSKTNKNSGLNALPPFQWSSANEQQTTSKNNDTMDQMLMPPPIITRGLKSSGIRKLVAQYTQMESDVTTMKKRIMESKQNEKSMKQTIRLQRDKSRQLITACAFKLQEKEAEVEKIRYERDAQLAKLASELTYLQANMLKEQKRLEMVIVEKQAQMDAQAIETERLKKMNKVLSQQMANLQSKSKLMAMLEDRDMDTPSSEDSSPKSSFSTKTTKIEIKPRSLNNELLSPDSSSDMVVTVLPSMSVPSSSSSSTNLVGNLPTDTIHGARGSPMRVIPTSSQHQLGQNVTVGLLSTSTSSKRDQILPSLSLPVNQDNLGSLGHSPDILSPSSSPKKPPIPSRAGVNKKLQKSSPTSQPPPPPPRVSSNKRNSSREDKTDSGRESDDQNTSRLCLNVNDPAFEYVTGQIINSNNTGDGSNAARSKGKQVNFLASSSPKRDVNPVTMSGRTTTTTQKNFEEYKNSNEFNKTKSNRQKTYLHPNNNTDEKENKFNNGDRTTDEGFSSSHEDHNQQISLSPSSSQAGYDDYLNYAGLNQKSIGHPSPSSMVVPANKTSTLPSSNISALSNNTINNSNNNNNSNNQIKTMTNHRAVQKPSDIKNRSKLKAPSSISNLSVLEEHQVSGEGQVTTVTYWTEPYL